jgi:hypothetical protein
LMCFISTAARSRIATPFPNCRLDRFHPEKKPFLA